jgi:hypothetical protein
MSNTDSYFQIKGINENDFIRIDVNGLKFPLAELDWDRNTLDSVVKLKVGGFSANLLTDLMTTDFKLFKRELEILYNNLNGTATFEGIEGDVLIHIKGDGIGYLSADCFLTDFLPDGNELKCGIGFDQTLIPKLIKQLEKITAEFLITGELKIPN